MHLKKIVIDHNRFPTHDNYPFCLPVLQRTNELSFDKPIVIFTGENGTGKSTLLKAICKKCNIHIWEGMGKARYKVNKYENRLHHSLSIEWTNGTVPGSFFSPELFRNFSQLVDAWAADNPGMLKYYGGDSLMTQSHGQSCMAYFKARYQIKGIHFLDEPEAALSPKTQLQLMDVLEDTSSRCNSQFIISTHSPILMSLKNAKVYSFDDTTIKAIEYRDTQHYQIYSQFFNKTGK